MVAACFSSHEIRKHGADFLPAPAANTSKTTHGHSSSRDHARRPGAPRRLSGAVGRDHVGRQGRLAGGTLADRSNELKTYILGLALAVVLFAGLMSLSRGGMAALFIAALVSAASAARLSQRTAGSWALCWPLAW